MKGLLLAALLSVLTPLTASADWQNDHRDGRHEGRHDGGRNHQGDNNNVPRIPTRPGEIYRGGNGRHYVVINRVCGLSHVALYVNGDGIMIEDFDVLFGNGATQDIQVREKFKRDSASNWKPLVNGENLRCIDGFSIKARPDLDWDDSRIYLYGMKQTNWGPQSVQLGSVKVRDLEIFERR